MYYMEGRFCQAAGPFEAQRSYCPVPDWGTGMSAPSGVPSIGWVGSVKEPFQLLQGEGEPGLVYRLRFSGLMR